MLELRNPGIELTLLGDRKEVTVRLGRTEPPIEFNKDYPARLEDGRGRVRISVPSADVTGAFLAVLAREGHLIWEGRLRVPPWSHLIRLPPSDMHLLTLWGVVSDDKTNPIEDADVVLARFLDGAELWKGRVRSGADGVFEIPRLLPGAYHIRISSKRHQGVVAKRHELLRSERLDVVLPTSYVQHFVVTNLDRIKEFQRPYYLTVEVGIWGRQFIERWQPHELKLDEHGRASLAVQKGQPIRVQSLQNQREKLEHWSASSFIAGERNPFPLSLGGHSARVRIIVRRQTVTPWCAIELIRPGSFNGIDSDLKLLEWERTETILLGSYVLVASTPGHRVVARTIEVREGMEPITVEFVADPNVREADLPRNDLAKLKSYLELLKYK